MARRKGLVRVKPYTRKGRPVKGYVRGGPVKTRSGVPMRRPFEDISPTFGQFVDPVSPSKRRPVYVFLEAGPGYEFESDSGEEPEIIPVKIGPYTRGQLAKLSRQELLDEILLFKPGLAPGRIVGFGHAQTPAERKGKRFTRAKRGSRSARKTSNLRRNRSTKKGRKKS